MARSINIGSVQYVTSASHDDVLGHPSTFRPDELEGLEMLQALPSSCNALDWRQWRVDEEESVGGVVVWRPLFNEGYSIRVQAGERPRATDDTGGLSARQHSEHVLRRDPRPVRAREGRGVGACT